MLTPLKLLRLQNSTKNATAVGVFLEGGLTKVVQVGCPELLDASGRIK